MAQALLTQINLTWPNKRQALDVAIYRPDYESLPFDVIARDFIFSWRTSQEVNQPKCYVSF